MVRGLFQSLAGPGRVVAFCALAGACAQIHNEPINLPLQGGPQPAAVIGDAIDTRYDDTVIALSFSGGGTRAAAFSYGTLTALDQAPLPNRPVSLLDRVDFVTGVSGGSILAAYYGLKKRKALVDFKQRFLLRNAQENLQMDLSLLNIARGLQGGINDPTAFSTTTCSNTRPSEPSWRSGGRISGSTPPISTTAPPSSSAR